MNILDATKKISGEVIKGRQLGRSINFPTANINYLGDLDILFGVYGCIVKVLNKKFYGIINVGKRPTIEDGDKITYEVNIFDFDCDIYNEKLNCELLYFVRSEKKFRNIDELKIQIKKDIFEVREKFGI